jgi:hypothetical protein
LNILPSHFENRLPVDDSTVAKSPAVADDNDDSGGFKNSDLVQNVFYFINDGGKK